MYATGVLFAFSLVLVAIEWYGPLPRAGPALNGVLTDAQKQAIGLIVDLAKLFMGWSLAVIGGSGYFLRANLEKDFPLSRRDLYLAEAVILASVVSIFYGHMTINFIVGMLILDVMTLSDAGLASYIRVQYLAFLLSLLLFGGYIHSTFFERARTQRRPSVETQ